jgi:tetratricopeptide (TPR) repeat protein
MNLSVFHGFSQQAAGEVAGATPAVLKSLADKSLLRLTSSARYEMHELLRQYAAEKLAATPTAHETHNRHCTYYAAFLQRQEAALAGTDAVQAVAAIKAEFGNVPAAWHWAATHARLEAIEQSINGLSRFYVLAGPFQEAARVFRMAIDALSIARHGMQAPLILSRLLVEEARFLNKRGMYEQAAEDAESAVGLAQANQAAGPEAAGRVQWGAALWNLGNYAGACPQLEQALALAHTAQSHPVEADSLYNLGFVYWHLGNYAAAGGHFEGALRIYREIGDRQSESLALACLGLLAHHLGDDETAHERCHQALRIARDIGNRRVEGYALTRLGHALAGLGRLAEAAETYRQALALQRELGQANLAMEPLAGLARVSLAQGDLAQARAHVAEILAHLEGHTLDGTDEPLRVYLTCYRVLCAAQDARAQEILATAHRLLRERAARIGNEELRRSFLENVAVHREIARALESADYEKLPNEV